MEFGEKLKQARQKKGFTQQTMADRLYVTRQAVSRWECGVRYPDLLTAKKISQILEVSIDELLSGEELRENIEKEPLLARSTENIVQTLLYTVVAVAYLLMNLFSLYSLFFPNRALAHTPAGRVSIQEAFAIAGRAACFAVFLTGLVCSARNRLSARLTGFLMCFPFMAEAGGFLVAFGELLVKKNGHIGPVGWLADFAVPVSAAIYVLFYFRLEERKLPCAAVLAICVLAMGDTLYVLRGQLPRTTDLGRVVMTVHGLGKLGMNLLLGYQALVWDQKKKLAYRSK